MYDSNTGNASRSLGSTIAGVVLLGATVYPGVSAAFDIQFDYSFDTNGFFNDTARQDVLNAAAGFFETHITDDLLAITPDGTTNIFDAQIAHPATGAGHWVNNLSVAADTLVVFVGARDLAGNTLGVGGPGGFAVSGFTSFVDAARTRGEGTLDDVQGATATEFAPWGGSISFDTTTTWYFDSDTTTDETFFGNDFYSVALHELGHVLGFGIANSWDNQINVSGEFTGTSSVAAYGGNIDLTADGGHWADSSDPSPIYGTTTNQEAAMDPTIFTGTRKRFTEQDMAGLEDIGWTVTPASAQ